jgi:hypothetical protein
MVLGLALPAWRVFAHTQLLPADDTSLRFHFAVPARSGSNEPLDQLTSLHSAPVTALKYNEPADTVISTDSKGGRLPVWLDECMERWVGGWVERLGMWRAVTLHTDPPLIPVLRLPAPAPPHPSPLQA